MRPCQECPHFCRMEWNLYQLKGTSPKPVAAWSSTKIAPSGRQLYCPHYYSVLKMEAFWENCSFAFLLYFMF